MHLEHLNLVVKDLEIALEFYKVVFPHWKIRTEGESEWYGVKRNWLHFGDDYQYLSLNDNGSGENRALKENQVGLAHFAFVTDNLDSIIKRLVNAGFEIATPITEREFRRNVYFIDPDGYEVEFVEYLSDLPQERNSD